MVVPGKIRDYFMFFSFIIRRTPVYCVHREEYKIYESPTSEVVQSLLYKIQGQDTRHYIFIKPAVVNKCAYHAYQCLNPRSNKVDNTQMKNNLSILCHSSSCGKHSTAVVRFYFGHKSETSFASSAASGISRGASCCSH